MRIRAARGNEAEAPSRWRRGTRDKTRSGALRRDRRDEPLAALRPTPAKHGTPARRRHARAKPVTALSLRTAGLIRALHESLLIGPGPGPRRLVRPTPRVKPSNRRAQGGPKARRRRVGDEFEIRLFTSNKGGFGRISERNHCHLGNRRSVESTGRLLLPFERSPRPGQAPPNPPPSTLSRFRVSPRGAPSMPWGSCAQPPDRSTVDAGTG